LLKGEQQLESEHDEGVKWLASASATGLYDAQRILKDHGYGPDGILLKVGNTKTKKRHRKKKIKKEIPGI